MNFQNGLLKKIKPITLVAAKCYLNNFRRSQEIKLELKNRACHIFRQIKQNNII